MVFNSCEEEALDHRKYDLDLDDFMLFPEGSSWTYLKHHSKPDSIEFDKIELLEIKEEFVPSKYGDYFALEREDIFFSSHDSAIFSRFTRETEIEIDGQSEVVYETVGSGFVFYSDIQESGFVYPYFDIDSDHQGNILYFPERYWYAGLINENNLSSFGSFGGLVGLNSLNGYINNIRNITPGPGLPEGKRIGNGLTYHWVEVEPDTDTFHYVQRGGFKELFLLKDVGTAVKLDKEAKDIWFLIDYFIAPEE